MAKLIDKLPKYEGEKKVWNTFSINLPQHWVIYNTRSVNGREYDFCVMAPNMGLFMVEVKGWVYSDILTVVNENTIFLAGYEDPEDSPRGQARGYRFDLLNKIKKELGMNPLVMSLVCYPFITKKEYFEKGLNVVSEANETIFADELDDPSLLFKKFSDRYNVDKGAKHDDLNTKRFAILRHHFEPNYDLKQDVEDLNPGYSRLRVLKCQLSFEQINEIVEEYFSGIKEIVFVSTKEELKNLIAAIDRKFNLLKISLEKGNLKIGVNYIDVSKYDKAFNIFNFEVEVVESLADYVSDNILIEEGLCSEDEKDILKELSEVSAFNFQQYEIEHAPSDKNILVAAGAGTGKTFSMVSRVAYLCNRTVDSVVDIVGDIAMITFTNDAAENMNKRVKRMFMNYFILTSKEKYMHLIEDMSQVQISTIHKFAIALLKTNCIKLGLGYDCQISNETYNRRQWYHFYLNEYLRDKNEKNPDFVRQLSLPTYKLEELLISFCDKLYDRSVDIKKLEEADFDNPTSLFPFFNEMIINVAIKAEKTYAQELKDNNLLGLRECMILIHKLVKEGKLMQQGHRYKYLFVDEFQDTDDVQIETITELQKIFGVQCHLFVVGDLKQSIYRFRGATLSAFDRVQGTQNIGAWQPTYVLNRNYRTDQRLLDLFNEIFLKMGETGMLPYNEESDRLTSQLVKEYPNENLLNKIEVHSKDKDGYFEELFKVIKNQIARLEELDKTKKLSKEERTIAILVRYNYQIANIISAVEKNADVDFTIKVTEGGDLYRLKSTVDLYKMVLAATHPTNKVYLTNLIKSNYVSLNLNLGEISGYGMQNKTEELINILDEYFMLHLGKNWNQVVSDFESRPILVVLREIYEAVKPWKCYEDELLQKEYRENFDCLIEKIIRKYSREYMTINKVAEFLKINITTYQEEASRKTKNETNEIQVICTTIHKSKGLEYGTVIVPYTNEDISNIEIGGLNVNIIEGKVSYSFSIKGKGSDYSGGFDDKSEEKEKICEESRVLYVALTRAIRNLVWFKDLDTKADKSWGYNMEVTDNGNNYLYI